MRHSMLIALATCTAWAATDDAAPAPSMTETARAFLDSLEGSQRQEALFAFNAEERLDWHYVPRERPGLSLKKMTADQKVKALAFLRASLSAMGFAKTETIRALDGVLHEMEGGNPGRDPDRYDLALFGEPSATEPWGARYEGHHISLSWTVLDNRVVASTPQFLGAHPADVAAGPMKGTRALSVEEDLARSLVKSLNPEQQAKVVQSATAPREILTGAQREAAIQEDTGIAFGELSEAQQGMLLTLLSEYANAQTPPVARERIEKVKAAGLEHVKFAWMGGLEKGQGHYYRIQGPTFLVEYDNTQDHADHIHTVWRDFNGDFGRDVLKEHYQRVADPAHPGEHRH